MRTRIKNRQIHPKTKLMKSTHTLRRLLLAAIAGIAVVFAISEAQAGSPINKTTFGGLALKGYDPVSYFEGGKPVEGSKEFTHSWGGATWRFTSAAHRDAFVKSPEKYAPQYGGYCAWAASDGKKADINPSNWRIVDGKLYLNYNDSIQKKWEADIPGFITKADAQWPSLKNK